MEPPPIHKYGTNEFEKGATDRRGQFSSVGGGAVVWVVRSDVEFWPSLWDRWAPLQRARQGVERRIPTRLKPSVPCFATVAATNRNTQRMHTYLGGEEQLGTDNKQTAASPCCRTRLHWLWTRAWSLCCSDLTQTMRSDFSSTVCCKSSTRTEFIVCVNASVSERGVFSRNPKGDWCFFRLSKNVFDTAVLQKVGAILFSTWMSHGCL